MNLRRVDGVDVERELELEELVSLSPVSAGAMEKEGSRVSSLVPSRRDLVEAAVVLVLRPLLFRLLLSPVQDDVALTPQSRTESSSSRPS